MCYAHTFSDSQSNSCQNSSVLITSNHCLNQRSVSRTVNQRELQRFHLELAVTDTDAVQMLRDVNTERREPQIKRYSPFLALRVFIETRCARDSAHRFSKSCFTAVNMSQNTNVEIEHVYSRHLG